MKGQELKEYAELAAKNYLSPALQASQGTVLRSLPEDVKSQVVQIIEGSDQMSVDFANLIPRILSSNLDPDSKSLLLDYANLLHVSQILNGSDPSSIIICEKIAGLKSQELNKEVLYSFLSDILRQEINSTETLKELTPYVKILKLIEEPVLGYLKGLIEIQASYVIDIGNVDIVHIAEQLNAFSEFADIHDYSFNNDIISNMLNKLNDDQILKGYEYQGESTEESLIDSDEKIQKALNLVRKLDLGEDNNTRIAGFISFFNVMEEEKEKNIEAEKEELLTYQTESSYAQNLEIVIKEAKNIIEQLSIKTFDQTQKIESIWTIIITPEMALEKHIPEKHVEVWKVLIKDENNNDILVAMKCNYTRVREKFLTDQAEYMALMQNHRNFLKLYGAFWDIDKESKKDRYNLIMEYAPETLARRIERWEDAKDTQKSYREAEALVAAKELISAMRDLNEKNISHRDLKPDNIFITQENVYKIGDFDASKKHEKDKYGISIMISNAGFAGTKEFVSPELWALPSKKTSVRIDYNTSDVYSLGLTILRMVTKRNFGSWNCFSDFLESNMQMVINEEVSDINLKEILKKMLIVDPTTRPKFRQLAQMHKEILITNIDN